jgi:hypothetical protein
MNDFMMNSPAFDREVADHSDTVRALTLLENNTDLYRQRVKYTDLYRFASPMVEKDFLAGDRTRPSLVQPTSSRTSLASSAARASIVPPGCLSLTDKSVPSLDRTV